MANLILGVTGSVAAIKTPELVSLLKRAGHDVRVVATARSLYFFDPAGVAVVRDSDEWPKAHYQRGDEVLHIELRKWADVLLVAPLDANTLAKIANGICDNLLSCVYRCWDPTKPIVLAPAMNTFMWDHPVTTRHLRQVEEDFAGLTVVHPTEKTLACGDTGIGAMAELNEIVRAVVVQRIDTADCNS